MLRLHFVNDVIMLHVCGQYHIANALHNVLMFVMWLKYSWNRDAHEGHGQVHVYQTGEWKIHELFFILPKF